MTDKRTYFIDIIEGNKWAAAHLFYFDEDGLIYEDKEIKSLGVFHNYPEADILVRNFAVLGCKQAIRGSKKYSKYLFYHGASKYATINEYFLTLFEGGDEKEDG